MIRGMKLFKYVKLRFQGEKSQLTQTHTCTGIQQSPLFARGYATSTIYGATSTSKLEPWQASINQYLRD
jgi:hypothetical protein